MAMAKIDTSRWKEFIVGDLFETEKTGRNVQVPTGGWIAIKNLVSGYTPRITVSGVNNGIVGYYEDIDDANYRVYENFISVSFLGTVFYQANKASLDMKVHCLKPLDIELNERIAFFLITVIKISLGSILYSDQISSTVLPGLKIMLPVDASGNPDWAYMDLFMQNVMNESKACLGNLRLAKEEKSKVDVSNWLPFKIGDLFEKLQLNIKNPDFNKALDVSEEQTKEFNLPLVNAKHGNNGIMYYGRESDFETAEMTIDIVQNGAIATGDVYAQPQKTGVLWDAYLIKPFADIQSEYTLMFLSTVIERSIKEHFSYDDKCVWDKASQLYVSLPVDKAGCPDWAYMDAFMSTALRECESALTSIKEIG
ncbi:Restriction enzyme BgcI subunit beta [Streptococcus anginosus]|nr:restriction endonuclease subunit S [Streptococcus anginosus]SCQ08858.1 Restriction enzyme BgcI subunit beta [Streptococcus anginosus]